MRLQIGYQASVRHKGIRRYLSTQSVLRCQANIYRIWPSSANNSGTGISPLILDSVLTTLSRDHENDQHVLLAQPFEPQLHHRRTGQVPISRCATNDRQIVDRGPVHSIGVPVVPDPYNDTQYLHPSECISQLSNEHVRDSRTFWTRQPRRQLEAMYGLTPNVPTGGIGAVEQRVEVSNTSRREFEKHLLNRIVE